MPSAPASSKIKGDARSSAGQASGSRAAPGKKTLAFSTNKPDGSERQSRLTFARVDSAAANKKKVTIQAPEQDFKGKKRRFDVEDGVGEGEQQSVTELWSVAFKPRSRSELAVHPRKVQDVETWLRDSFRGSIALKRFRRLLILTGPTGSGKTETIRQLSRSSELDFDILEWSNDVQSRFEEEPSSSYTSISSQLKNFFSRGSKFGSLSLASSQAAAGSGSSSNLSSSANGSVPARQRLILLEDLPSLSHAATLESFQDILATHLTQPLGVDGSHTPVVIIVSDVHASSGISQEDSFLSDDQQRRETDWMRPRRLLGPAVSSGDVWTEIKYNAVAPTYLGKAFKTILDRVGKEDLPARSDRQKTRIQVGPALVESVAESCSGDVRAGIDLLQQIYQRICREPDKFAPDASGSKRRSKEDKSASREPTKTLVASLGISGKEQTLDLFHALGKIMYNKRLEDDDDQEDTGDAQGAQASDRTQAVADTEKLPPHLAHLERRPSLVDVSALAASAVDTSMLQLFAHQNYTQYCSDLDQCESIAEAFSFAEAELKTKTGDHYYFATISATYAFLHTTSSLLLHLPSPVPRHGQRPLKPAYFDAVSRANESRSKIEDLKKLMPALGLKSSSEVAVEWIPLAGKMAKEGQRASKRPYGGPSKSGSTTSEAEKVLLGLATLDHGTPLTDGNSSVGRRWQSSNSFSLLSEADLPSAEEQGNAEEDVPINLSEVQTVERDELALEGARRGFGVLGGDSEGRLPEGEGEEEVEEDEIED